MISRYGSNRRRSSAVVHGGVAYLRGIVARDRKGDVKAQTTDILAQIEDSLKEIGSDKSKLLSATVYLANISDRDALNEIWDAWVDGKDPPSRTAVGVDLSSADTKVEIAVIAAL